MDMVTLKAYNDSESKMKRISHETGGDSTPYGFLELINQQEK